MTTMTQAIIIDGRARTLRTFVASVTKAQDDNPHQLVLRHALDMGNITNLLAPTERKEYVGGGETVTRRHFRADMPVIIMGTYSAMSSAGHVTVVHAEHAGYNEATDGHRKVLVVGGLGPAFGKGLKVFTNPISSTLVRGPVEIEEVAGSGNSNCASADAAWAGVQLLANTDRKSVFLVEGQSDYTYVVRLKSSAEDGETTEFLTEHRETMFSRENIVKRMIYGQSWRALAHGRDEDAPKPSDEEVRAEATQRIKEYIAAKAKNEDSYWDRLGRGFGSLNMSDEAYAKLAEELGVSQPSETASADDEFVEITEA